MRRTTILLLSLLAASANAATYKWIDADGRVTYSDRAPSASARPMNEPGGQPAAAPSGDSSLPYALRTAVSRYPVVLYTSRDCGVCDSGREMLEKRGVPFTERRLRTQAEVDALKARGFADFAVPAITVGGEKAAGFDADGWGALLDSAGYPKTSLLPRGWRPASAASAGSARTGSAVAGAPTPVEERAYAQPESVEYRAAPRALPPGTLPASRLRF
jgi:glutaredoxin